MSIRLRLLLVLAGLAAVSPMATDLYLPGFPEMSRSLHSDASGVQLTLTAFLVGMAVGQLVTGPLSDRLGRRRPLLVSVVLCVLAGAVCAVAPSLTVLVVARFAQGVAGAGGTVIGRAIVADLVSGPAAAKAMTLMLTVGGVAPILAPVVGGLLADPLGWRGLMWVVAGACVLLLVGVAVVVPETHPDSVRTESGVPLSVGLRAVARRRAFWGPVSVYVATFGVLMGYISSSSFVYQNVVGLSAREYGVAFGVNATGLIGAGWVSSRLVDRTSPGVLVRRAVGVQAAAAVGFLALAASGAPTWTIPVPLFVLVATVGFVIGNAAGLAMSQVRDLAGTGSALMGATQFGFGALISPLVGLGGAGSAVVPAAVITVVACLGLLASRTALPAPGLDSYSTSSSTSIATS